MKCEIKEVAVFMYDLSLFKIGYNFWCISKFIISCILCTFCIVFSFLNMFIKDCLWSLTCSHFPVIRANRAIAIPVTVTGVKGTFRSDVVVGTISANSVLCLDPHVILAVRHHELPKSGGLTGLSAIARGISALSFFVDPELHSFDDFIGIFVCNCGLETTWANKINTGIHFHDQSMIVSLFICITWIRISIDCLFSIVIDLTCRLGYWLPISLGLSSFLSSKDFERADPILKVMVFAIFFKVIIFKTDALHLFVEISPFFAMNDYRVTAEAIVCPQLDRVAVWNHDWACFIIFHIVSFHLPLCVLCCLRWVGICIKTSSIMLTVIVSK